MHAIEKIFAKNAGKKTVETGEIVMAKVDFAEINDLYLQTVYSFYEMGGEKVWDNTRCAFVFDHYAPCPTIKSAQNHKEMREFAQKNNLKYHFDTNCGVCHQVMPEAGLSWDDRGGYGQPYDNPWRLWCSGHGLRSHGYGHHPDDGGTVVPDP